MHRTNYAFAEAANAIESMIRAFEIDAKMRSNRWFERSGPMPKAIESMVRAFGIDAERDRIDVFGRSRPTQNAIESMLSSV
jgi:hypothetical protein